MLEQADLSFCGLPSPSVNAPPRSSGYSPFDISYGRTPPVTEKLKGDPQQLADLELSRHLQDQGSFLPYHPKTLEKTPILLGKWVHPYQPRDEVWVKDWKKKPLQPIWTGTHTVVLAITTAVKVTGVTTWIHHTRVSSGSPQHLESSSRPQEPSQGPDPKVAALTHKGCQALL